MPYLGLNNALMDLADPPHFSPEIGATETFKKSPEIAETMASLVSNIQIPDFTLSVGQKIKLILCHQKVVYVNG